MKKLFQRICRNEKGLAIAEFALIAPVMIMLFLGTVETFLFLNTKKSIEQTAASIGLILSKRDYVDQTFMTTLLNLSKAIAGTNSRNRNNGSTTSYKIESMYLDGNNKYCVVWQAKFNLSSENVTTDTSINCSDANDTVMRNNFFTSNTSTTLVNPGDGLITVDLQFSYAPFAGVLGSSPISVRRQTVHPSRTAAYTQFCPTGQTATATGDGCV